MKGGVVTGLALMFLAVLGLFVVVLVTNWVRTRHLEPALLKRLRLIQWRMNQCRSDLRLLPVEETYWLLFEIDRCYRRLRLFSDPETAGSWEDELGVFKELCRDRRRIQRSIERHTHKVRGRREKCFKRCS